MSAKCDKLEKMCVIWMTNGILKTINNRNILYKKLNQSRIDSVDYIIKKTDFNKYLIDINYNMKTKWSFISETLNRKMNNPIPETMTINGQDCVDKETKAVCFGGPVVNVPAL